MKTRKPRRKSFLYLVSHIKENVEISLADDLGQFPPLFRFGIDSSWVMSTGMEKNNASFRNFLEN